MKERNMVLRIASHALDYPDESFMDSAAELVSTLDEYIETNSTRHLVMEALQSITQLELQELQELYVSTFDYKDKTGLYLTAHELGDNRKRGIALIELQQLIEGMGYERKEGELSDFMPMLMELLTIMPEDEASKRLQRRMACAIDRIMLHLPADHAYFKTLNMLMELVFDAPNAEDLALFEKEHEEADTELMPYPMLYK